MLAEESERIKQCESSCGAINMLWLFSEQPNYHKSALRGLRAEVKGDFFFFFPDSSGREAKR